MLLRPILLMTLPPGDDDFTRPGDPYMPDIASTTQPMASPYQGDAGAPPPPPATGPVPAWQRAAPPRPRLPRTASRPNGLLFIAGMLVAVALVAFAGIAFALSQNKGGTPQGNGNTAQVGTATPAPTKAPTAAPTIAPTPQPTTAPANQSGFVTYTGDPSWTIQYPNGTNVQTSTTPAPQGVPVQVQKTAFLFHHNTQFDVFDLPVLAGDPGQTLFNFVVQGMGATNVQILNQGSVQIGANTWYEVHVQAEVQDTHMEAIVLYTTHNASATAILTGAPVKNFSQANNGIFQPMIQSFAYTS